jgi:chorismate-pyruvate lyase
MGGQVDLGSWFDDTRWRSICRGPVAVGEAFVPDWLPAVTDYVTLSSAHRMLLATDGSITRLLEAVSGRPIDARVLSQEDLPAPVALAGPLEVEPGHTVTFRLATLCDRDQIVCVAGSVLVLDRLPPIVRAQLFTTTTPIGRIVVSSGVRAERRSVSVDVARPLRPLELFGPLDDDRFLVRESRLVTEGRVIATIRECFPYAVFAYDFAPANGTR